jgi:hypothetical protein
MPAPDSPRHQGIELRRRGGPEELDELEADLALARARVAASMHALGEEVSRRADWRAWVRERPGWTVVSALAVGFILGCVGAWPAPPFKRRY